jgi:hypothetical protein
LYFPLADRAVSDYGHPEKTSWVTMRHATEWTERTGTHGAFPRAAGAETRQLFHHSRTSLGAAGHWIHLGAVAAPVVIAEAIKDPDKRWRALRLVSVGAALASEAVWTYRLMKEREKDEAARAALRSCADR